MNLLAAIFKAFIFHKYRWVSIKFCDGSVLCGVVTKEAWEVLAKGDE